MILILMMAIAFLGYFFSLTCITFYSEHVELLTFVVVGTPSERVKAFLVTLRGKLGDKFVPVHILEYSDNATSTISVKKTLNSIAGVYMCVNLNNGNTYVGSAGLNRMYKRYTSHFGMGKGGSVLLKRAILKDGLSNFAFLVLEQTTIDKITILAREQFYLNLFTPAYNILKIANSLLGHR